MKKTPFFVAVDGEAISDRYCLIQDSHGGEIYRKEGLGTEEIFRWLLRRQMELETETETPCFVGFGTTYDCNMFFRDLDDKTLKEILQTEEKEYVIWKTWKILYFPRKLLRLQWNSLQQLEKPSFVLYDLLSFFGSSFVKAVEVFLPKSKGMREIRAGKAARGTFRQRDLAKVKAYNLRECQLLVSLADELRTRLEANKIYNTKWHGPGAVADYVLGKKGCNVHEDFPVLTEENVPEGLWRAWDSAYYGGRIETFILGSASTVYTYDINSAYPKAASLLPIVWGPRGWVRKKDTNLERLFYASVCLVRWDLTSRRERCRIGPFPWRDSTGRIFFPSTGEGWYWLPEVKAARRMYGDKIEVLDVWEQGSQEPSRLAQVIPELYAKRQALKKAGNPSEYALKIALNSIYGKFAQRTGKRPYFCLPWAGLITSYTRAMLLDAVRGNEDAVLSFATDSVTSRRPLRLACGHGLGEWKEERYKKFLCVMNGFYRLDDDIRKAKQANRGVNIRKCERCEKERKEVCLHAWDDLIEELNTKGTITFHSKKFITHSLAMHQHVKWGSKRLTFQDDEKVINPFHTTKRIFRKEKLDDWENDCSESDPPRKSGLSYPSSLSFAPDAVRDRLLEQSEIEAEIED